MNSCIYYGHVFHLRKKPKLNSFRYRIFIFSIDLAEISLLSQKFFWFSINRFNFFSLFTKDHFKFSPETPANLSEAAGDLFERQYGHRKFDRVVLVTHLRFLGYTFNPVSFYLFYKKDEISAILAEVNNTFGEQKPFWLSFGQKKFIDLPKEFYVSPFIETDQLFTFVKPQVGEKILIQINGKDKKSGDEILKANLSGKRFRLSSWRVLQFSLLVPFVTLKVIVLIHFQALKLFLKKVPSFKKI